MTHDLLCTGTTIILDGSCHECAAILGIRLDERAKVLQSEDTIQLIAKVLAWQDGTAPEGIPAVAGSTLMQDYALQCAEDLGLAPVGEPANG